MRGVHFFRSSAVIVIWGSSPHARGPPQAVSLGAIVLGIIPACAGSTISLGQGTVLIEDHPRMRGVHMGLSMPTLTTLGSSPHARGPHIDRRGVTLCNRIIPACAGST